MSSTSSSSKDESYLAKITASYDASLQITGDKVTFDNAGGISPSRQVGKVRDRYDLGHDTNRDDNATATATNNKSSSNRLALVTTDRQSGFDRMLALVPFKGQVLNLTSAYWFDVTKDIVPNHLVDVPHPNVSVVEKCTPFPIEFVVRSYMTGSTSTSIWKNYQDGVRNYCGHHLPDGMKKNQPLPQTILTPTTKEEHHDRPISKSEIISEKWMTLSDFEICENAALSVFAKGRQIASKRGLILVDTKYEFGKDSNGIIRLIDEVHTPDSSRYWMANTYRQRIESGMEPENIDKEFLRLWFRDHCDPYLDEVIPEAPKELVVELSKRYITLYELITGREFEFREGSEGEIAEAIQKSV